LDPEKKKNPKSLDHWVNFFNEMNATCGLEAKFLKFFSGPPGTLHLLSGGGSPQTER